MLKTLLIAAACVGTAVPAVAQGNSTDPLSVSSASSIAGAFARVSTTREERLQRAVAYVDRVCNSSRRRDQRECTRIWDMIATARAEAQAAQQR